MEDSHPSCYYITSSLWESSPGVAVGWTNHEGQENKSCQVSERQEEHDPLVSPQATRDLAQYDAAHHEEFKRYEMLKEHERRRYLESLGEEQRKEAERKLQEQQRRHREHPKVNVPVRTPHMLYHIQFLSRKKKCRRRTTTPKRL